MYIADRIEYDLNTIKSVAEVKEDGNTVALISKVLRDLGSLQYDYATIEVSVPTKKAKVETTKSDTKVTT